LEREQHFYHEACDNDLFMVLVSKYQKFFNKDTQFVNQLKYSNEITKMNIGVNNIECADLLKMWKDGTIINKTRFVKVWNNINPIISKYDDNEDSDNTKIDCSGKTIKTKQRTNNKNNPKDIVFPSINIKASNRINIIEEKESRDIMDIIPNIEEIFGIDNNNNARKHGTSYIYVILWLNRMNLGKVAISITNVF